MHVKNLSGLVSAGAILVSVDAAAQQLAFPTAEGFGRFAKGGRGGDVYLVSNLNDAGPGSLRECAEASGPRTCVFTVSGEIQVQDAIRVTSPYLTIAGQTAPGDGIQLSIRNSPSLLYPMLVNTHDVILRHFALRPGPSAQPSGNVDALLLQGQRIIVDHMSLSWASDEVLNIIGNGGMTGRNFARNASEITVQWSLMYEGLRRGNHRRRRHGYGAHFSDGPRDITFHHNLIAHTDRRAPNLGVVGQYDFVNNVTYNWDQYAAEIYSQHGSSFINWVGNVAIGGADTVNERRWVVNAFNNDPDGVFSFYVHDNIDYNRTDASVDERETLDPKDWQFLSPSPVGYGDLSVNAATITDPQQAYKDVLTFAGATRPGRDAADMRVVDEVRSCAGGIIDNPSERGGWPVLQSAAAPLDADADGMADDWEMANGLNPADPSDRNGDIDGDGYTNLEDYLNMLAGDDDGANVGQGTGADADPTCGRSFLAVRPVGVNELKVEPQIIRPGETATITYDAFGRSCTKRWNRRINPDQLIGTDTITPNQTIPIELICENRGIHDWGYVFLYATDDGQIPAPSVDLSTDKDTYTVGEPIELEWLTGAVCAKRRRHLSRLRLVVGFPISDGA